ncbi:MAG: DUF2007 domain-containing protein, partial [Bacteroidia bacterium]|nr:DUF2007 domain-containing protein [Bacteroidia bacterium]
MNDLITLKIFDNSMDAHLLKTRLEDAEIPVALFDETFITMDPILSNALGGIKLKIKEEDAERALDILKEIENAPVINEEDQVVTCPNCNSDKLMTGFKSFKGWKGIVSML